MAMGRCLVFERSGYWATALRRVLPDKSARLVEIRSWDQLIVELTEAPASVICMEALGIRPDEIMRRLAYLHDEAPFTRVVMLADDLLTGDDLNEYEPIWRDLGVVEVARSRHDLKAASRIVQRHIPEMSEEEPLRARLLRLLPWREGGREDFARDRSATKVRVVKDISACETPTEAIPSDSDTWLEVADEPAKSAEGDSRG
ncbi:MAG: hypothetical protein U1A77_06310 [Pirellulales bacterium]